MAAIGPQGQYVSLGSFPLGTVPELPPDSPPGTVLAVASSEAELVAIADRVRLGSAELEVRRRRRKAQRAARRRQR